ncbi:nicotinamide N-methyltransferase-like [Phyllobates terribilis]|uniref:nicotinamide N-methyltransferase-like n=1 Tax=Phyllobates terribilis TaxID=111132 RepID=UPI003CCB24F4
MLKVRDRCIMELKRWVDSRTGAFDWGHAAKLHVDTEGKSEHFQEKEEKVRSAAQHVVKCDLKKENIIELMVLPPADCIISAWLIATIIGYLRKLSMLLKPGGYIILIGLLDTTYYTVGKDNLRGLSYDEDFVKKALVGEGFLVDPCEVKERTVVSDLCDYKHVIFIVAHKARVETCLLYVHI